MTLRMFPRALVFLGAASVAMPAAALAQETPGWLGRHSSLQYGIDLNGLRVLRTAYRGPDPRLAIRGGGTVTGDFFFDAVHVQPLGPTVTLVLRGEASTANRNRFYGLGNQTDAAEPAPFYELDDLIVAVGPEVAWRPTPSVALTSSMGFRHLSTSANLEEDLPDEAGDVDDGGILKLLRPYGSGNFSQFVAAAEFTWSSVADHRAGARLRVGTEVHPAWLDVGTPFLRSHVEAAVVLPAGGWVPTVSAVARYDAITGEAPFHEMVYLGGRRSLRGFEKQRFAGTRGARGRLELLWEPGWSLVALGRRVGLGPVAVADIGRVWVDGHSVGPWHPSAGGGVWIRGFAGDRAAKLTVVRSALGFRAYGEFLLLALPD